MHTDKTKLNGITELIIGCAFNAANALKCKFFEKIYENALAHELTKNGLRVAQQIRTTCSTIPLLPAHMPVTFSSKTRC